jgi:hypothetical protein
MAAAGVDNPVMDVTFTTCIVPQAGVVLTEDEVHAHAKARPRGIFPPRISKMPYQLTLTR